jgi:hypothetical protein
MNIKSLFQQAESEKFYILGKYAEVARYTMPYTEVYNVETKTVSKKINTINPVILQSGLELKNFIMSTMLNNGGGWGDAILNKESFNELSLEIPQITQKQYNELSAKLEDYTSKTFELLASSGFYNAVSKAMMECENLGTGCVALIENDSRVTPFSFAYIPVNSIYFTEDALGKPVNTFRRFTDVNNDNIEDLFGISTDVDLEDIDILIESCVKQKDGTYIHMLTDDSFDIEIFKRTISYPAHIVFRWDTSLSNAYGIGIGMYLIDEFKKLQRFNELHMESAELMVNPPLGFHGSIEFMKKMAFSAGSVSYLGQDNSVSGISPIGLGTQLVPLEQEIAKSEAIIRESYISNPIGYYTDKSGTSATEINARLMLFREKFSGVYENLSDELLMTVFISVFKMLVDKGIFIFDKEYVDIIELRYNSEASRQVDYEKASNVLKFRQIGMAYFPKEMGFVSNAMAMYSDIGEKLGISKEYLNDEQKATELYLTYLSNAQLNNSEQQNGGNANA